MRSRQRKTYFVVAAIFISLVGLLALAAILIDRVGAPCLPDSSSPTGTSHTSTSTVTSLTQEERRAMMIPAWADRTVRSAHFVYHYSEPDKPIEGSLEAQERHYRFISETFGIEMPTIVHYVKYPSIQKARANMGHSHNCINNSIHSWLWWQPHEAAHAYLSSSNWFLSEGFAETFGSSFQADFHDFMKPWPVSSADLSKSLLKRRSSWRLRPNRDRFIASNFIRWVFFKYGATRVVELVSKGSDDPDTMRTVVEQLFGMPLKDVATQWEQDQSWLKQQASPPGFFARSPWVTEFNETAVPENTAK